MKTGTTILLPISSAEQSYLHRCLRIQEFIGIDDKIIFVLDYSLPQESTEFRIRELLPEGVRYEYCRNETPVNIFAACIRAVSERDKSDNNILFVDPEMEYQENLLVELSACLFECERHGIAFPNSNLNRDVINKTLPLFNQTASDSLNYQSQIKSLLCRHEIIATGLIPCLLIRRSLIDKFFSLDKEIEYDFGKLDDLIVKLSNYGYSTVRCNHTFAFVKDPNTQILRASDDLLELGRNQYQIQGTSHFQSLLLRGSLTKSVLISFYDFPLMYNGTTEYGILFLDNLSTSFRNRYAISILANKEACSFHNLEKFGFPIFFPEDIEGRLFDICFVPRQIFSFRHLFLINRASPRIVASFLDIIALRCQYLSDHSLKILWATSLRYFQKIICISESVKSDILCFFDLLSLDIDKFAVIYLGRENSSGEVPTANRTHNPPYYLVIGNSFKHKAVFECLVAIGRSNLQCQFVVLGANPVAYSFLDGDKRFRFVESGFLDVPTVESLYSEAVSLIFPSQYEGFGLPILKAVKYGKRMILASSAVNHEITSLIKDGDGHFLFFDKFEDIPRIIESFERNSDFTIKKMLYERTWQVTTRSIEDLIEAEVSKDIDCGLLNQRFETINSQYYLFNYVPDVRARGIIARIVNKGLRLLGIKKFFR